MGLETIALRPFQREDALLLEDTFLPNDIGAIANSVIIDGAVAAYAGVHPVTFPPHRTRHFAFFRIADDARGALLKTKAPLFVARIVRDALKTVTSGGIDEVFVLCDESFPRAREFLSALGFRRAERMAFDLISIEVGTKMDIWVYQGKAS